MTGFMLTVLIVVFNFFYNFILFVTGFWKITHMGANDTVFISLLKAAFNFEFFPIYGCNKLSIPKITSTVKYF